MANLNEPFVLATYYSTLRGNLNLRLGAFASVHQRSNEYVTVGAQADGVHILDVANLHPVISHTLGPSTTFSCPPLSLSSSKHSWTTLAVISSSSELPSIDDANRTLWMWSVESSKEKEKKTKSLFSKGKSVHSLHTCQELPGRIVALSNTGDVTILNPEDLETISNYTPKTPDMRVLYSWLFPKSVKILGDSQKVAIMILIVSGTTGTTHLRFLAIDEANSISQLQEQNIELSSENIISAACNCSGFLSILSKDGVWSLFSLPTSLNQSSTTLPIEKSLRLTSLPFLGSSSCFSGVSTLAMTSSHVLLASTLPSQEIALHIWDLRFAVLLTSYTLSIPSSLSSTALHLTLLGSQNYQTAPRPQKDCNTQQEFLSGQAYLIISSAPSYSRARNLKDKQETKLTSIIFAVPYTIPGMSTIAAAMGRGAVSKRWLKNDSRTQYQDRLDVATKDSAAEMMRNDLLLSLQLALRDGRVQAAETTFMKWASSLTGKEGDDTANNLTFGCNFVKNLLEIVFLPLSNIQLQKTSLKRSYASEITHYLLEQGVISSAMLAPLGGLLSVLRRFDDWKGIEKAFSKVLDLTEMEIVETLKVVVTHHRHSRPPLPPASEVSDTMQVDPEAPPKSSHPTSTIPSSVTLASYLHLVAIYPTSRVPLLIAFRRYMKDAEDVTTLLQMLSSWVEKRSKMDMDPGVCRKLMPSKKDLKKTKEGVWTVIAKTRQRDCVTTDKKKPTVPPLEKIMNVVQALLDSCFLSLLSYKPSHQILYNLSSQLTPEIAFTHAAQDLLGALEPFSIAQEKSIRDSMMPKDEREREKQKIDWRQRKKGAGAAIRADIGVYTLEDLVL